MPVKVFKSRNLFRRIREAANKGLEQAARDLPDAITLELKSGRKPSDGSSQPPLAQSTIESKRRRGAPLIPGVDTGLLSTASNWDVVETAQGWEVYPPAERLTAVYYLENRADPYEIVATPGDWQATTLSSAIKAAFRRS